MSIIKCPIHHHNNNNGTHKTRVGIHKTLISGPHKTKDGTHKHIHRVRTRTIHMVGILIRVRTIPIVDIPIRAVRTIPIVVIPIRVVRTIPTGD